jgi:UDP-hydrolysing UDP-N-acetyl-D-glucosamine 2-epimerase
MKLCVAIGSRANWGRLKSVCDEAEKYMEVEKLVFCTGMKFTDGYVLKNYVSGDDRANMVLTSGLISTQVSNALDHIKPDVVLVHGDRYEVLPVAASAMFMNIRLAHTEGGEHTGCIDNKIRAMITAAADIHFPVTDKAAQVIRKAVEHTDTVKVVGSTALDWIKRERVKPENYVLAVLHPETMISENPIECLEALKELGHVIFVNPNTDAGAIEIARDIHKYGFEMRKNLSPEEYVELMKRCALMIGNTSSGIKEGSYLGIPYVCVGNRQDGREKDHNVIDSPMNKQAILDAAQGLYGERFPYSNKFGDGHAAERIVKTLLCARN